MLRDLTQQVLKGADLQPGNIRLAVGELVNENISAEVKADFLYALARKGETTEEIAAFAVELLSRCLHPLLDEETKSREILDVCGTGGDHLGTFNISTTVAIILAAAGVTVAKHGNRAITSKTGSADVLEALGIQVDLAPEQAGRWLKELHFAFFFAQRYHPCFKHISPARKLCAERGQHTLFNYLGPLMNPARPTAQLVGVPNPQLCERVARVLQFLGTRRAMVVSGLIPDAQGVLAVERSLPSKTASHLDEFSILGENTVAEFYQDRGFTVSVMTCEHLPVRPASLADLKGGDREANAEIIRQIINGKDQGPKRDAVLLNAAAALFVAQKVKSLTAGWDYAAQLIDSGKAATKLQALIAASSVHR